MIDDPTPRRSLSSASARFENLSRKKIRFRARCAESRPHQDLPQLLAVYFSMFLFISRGMTEKCFAARRCIPPRIRKLHPPASPFFQGHDASSRCRRLSITRTVRPGRRSLGEISLHTSSHLERRDLDASGRALGALSFRILLRRPETAGRPSTSGRFPRGTQERARFRLAECVSHIFRADRSVERNFADGCNRSSALAASVRRRGKCQGSTAR